MSDDALRKQTNQKERIILQASCPDKPGIIAEITKVILAYRGNIIKLEQHVESHDRFFMRLEIEMAKNPKVLKSFFSEVKFLEKKLEGKINHFYSTQTLKAAVLVGKEPHCLIDLLAKKESGELNCEIPFIVSNWPDLEYICKRHKIPFYYLPILEGKETDQQSEILKLLEKYKIDLIILARYMRLIPKTIIKKYPEQIINIHHSFLPAFQGAKPYQQAWDRGVKIIGATAHYATEKLDEGPIIAQDVRAVSHQDSVEDMIKIGRDIERRVLNEAVSAWLDHKIMLYNERTIIFK